MPSVPAILRGLDRQTHPLRAPQDCTRRRATRAALRGEGMGQLAAIVSLRGNLGRSGDGSPENARQRARAAGSRARDGGREERLGPTRTRRGARPRGGAPRPRGRELPRPRARPRGGGRGGAEPPAVSSLNRLRRRPARSPCTSAAAPSGPRARSAASLQLDAQNSNKSARPAAMNASRAHRRIASCWLPAAASASNAAASTRRSVAPPTASASTARMSRTAACRSMSTVAGRSFASGARSAALAPPPSRAQGLARSRERRSRPSTGTLRRARGAPRVSARGAPSPAAATSRRWDAEIKFAARAVPRASAASPATTRRRCRGGDVAAAAARRPAPGLAGAGGPRARRNSKFPPQQWSPARAAEERLERPSRRPPSPRTASLSSGGARPSAARGPVRRGLAPTASRHRGSRGADRPRGTRSRRPSASSGRWAAVVPPGELPPSRRGGELARSPAPPPKHAISAATAVRGSQRRPSAARARDAAEPTVSRRRSRPRARGAPVPALVAPPPPCPRPRAPQFRRCRRSRVPRLPTRAAPERVILAGVLAPAVAPTQGVQRRPEPPPASALVGFRRGASRLSVCRNSASAAWQRHARRRARAAAAREAVPAPGRSASRSHPRMSARNVRRLGPNGTGGFGVAIAPRQRHCRAASRAIASKTLVRRARRRRGRRPTVRKVGGRGETRAERRGERGISGVSSSSSSSRATPRGARGGARGPRRSTCSSAPCGGAR